MKKNKADNWHDSVEKKLALKKMINEIKTTLSSPRLFNLSSKQYAGSDAVRRLESFIHLNGNGREDKIPERKRDELVTLKDEAAKKKKEYQDLYEEKQRLEKTLAALEEELRQFELSAEAADIIGQQKKIDSLKDEISSFEKAIAEQQLIISDNQVAKPVDLHRQREELLADSSLGVDVAEQLQTVEQKISGKQKEMESAQELCAAAKNTIQGLSRKIDEGKSKIEILERDKEEMIIAFLKSEMRGAEIEYQIHAEALIDSYRRLYALDSLLTRIPDESGVSVFSGEARRIQVPNVAPISKLSGFLFDANQFTGYQGWIADEKARLTDQGIVL